MQVMQVSQQHEKDDIRIKRIKDKKVLEKVGEEEQAENRKYSWG